jgi:hypothetical protein
LSNAPGMTLAGMQRKTPKGGFSALCDATPRASSRLFGQSLEGEFSEVELPLYGVLGGSHSPGPTPGGILMYRTGRSSYPYIRSRGAQ